MQIVGEVLAIVPSSCRCDPQPQSVGDDRHGADPAEPQDHKPRQLLQERPRLFLSLRQW
jgi:hypothetical protein